MSKNSKLSMVIFSAVTIFIALSSLAHGAAGGKKIINRVKVSSIEKSKLAGMDPAVTRDRAAFDEKQSLGFDARGPFSPGIIIGYTVYDNQSYGRMNRQVDWRSSQMVHFTWAKQLEFDIYEDGVTGYEAWDPDDGQLIQGGEGGGCDLHPRLGFGINYSAYSGLDVDTEGKVVIANHHDGGAGFASTVWYDFWPGSCFFGPYTWRIPDETMQWGVPQDEIDAGYWRFLWPSIEYQVLYGDTVTHVVARQKRDDDNPSRIHYFRRVGSDTVGSWDFPPMFVDITHTISQTAASSRMSGKVALVWTAPVPGGTGNETDNDIYYLISYDMGASWETPYNLTNSNPMQPGWRAGADLSCLIDTDDYLHIIWNAREYSPEDGGIFPHFYGSRLFHWDEFYDEIRVIKDANWDLPEENSCHGGAWNEMSIVKPMISECDGKFYVLFVQFNDIDNGISDDCHDDASTWNQVRGTANGELYISVSDNRGFNWDAARNLTNSYTPHCTGEPGFECGAEHWPSMSRFGMEVTMGDFTGVPIVDPTGGYTGDFYLDVLYVNDEYPGSCLGNVEIWTTNSVKWFRVPCIESESTPVLAILPRAIGDPTWTKPGIQLDTTIRLENVGNVPLSISSITAYDDGLGWLEVGNHGPFSISDGSPNYYDLDVYLNYNGAISTGPGGYQGYLQIESDNTGGTVIVDIHLIVADSVEFPETADIRTECKRLVFSNTGNLGGNGGLEGNGTYNMDFVGMGIDCDVTDNVSGADDDASVYLYTGSPFISYVKDGDTILNYAGYEADWLSKNGFRPLTGPYADSTSYGGYQYGYSGQFLSGDSSIGLECAYFAPKDPGNCDFIVVRQRIYNVSNAVISGLHVGDFLDWNIPSDSGVENGSDHDAGRKLQYMYGGEYGPDGIENNDCVLADQRMGGVSYYGGFKAPYCTSDDSFPDFQAMWTEMNVEYVDPTGGFVPEIIYREFEHRWGYEEWETTMPMEDSLYVDLHQVALFGQFDLDVHDTLVFCKILATEYDGGLSGLLASVDAAMAWIDNHPEVFSYPPYDIGRCCYGIGPLCTDNSLAECLALEGEWDPYLNCTDNPCPVDTCSGQYPGDADGNGWLSAYDGLYIKLYLYDGGPPPDPLSNGDTNGDCYIDIRDIIYLIVYLYKMGPSPAECTCVEPAKYPPVPTGIVTGVSRTNVDGYKPSDGDPRNTLWLEFHPYLPGVWQLTEWGDNGDGKLSASDTVDFVELLHNYELSDYVKQVSPTMRLAGDFLGYDTIWVDMIDSPAPDYSGIANPWGSFWREYYPRYGRVYQMGHAVYWTGYVSPGDTVSMMQVLNGPDSLQIIDSCVVDWLGTAMVSEPIGAIQVAYRDNDGPGSLRWALDLANLSPDQDTIVFSTSGTINLNYPLPELADDSTLILGSTAPGGAHSIVLDGSGLSSGYGLRITSSNNFIEGLSITGFPGNGVCVVGDSAQNNTMTDNLIYGNGGLGIDLGDDGVTINDSGDVDDGPNGLLNYPVIDSARSQPDTSFTVYGYAGLSGTVELYVAHPGGQTSLAGDPSGHGEAYYYIGTTVADPGTGAFSFNLPKDVKEFSLITATATDQAGNTSEYSQNFLIPPGLLSIAAYSPVNLWVTDPNGDYIGKDADGVLHQTIMPAEAADYAEDPPEYIDVVSIYYPIYGDYTIQIFAENDPISDDTTYSIGIRLGTSEELVMALNMPAPPSGDTVEIIYTVEEGWHYVNGDADGNRTINILDVTYIINFLYKNGPAPDPMTAADANCDMSTNLLDVTYIINYLYKLGNPPCAILE